MFSLKTKWLCITFIFLNPVFFWSSCNTPPGKVESNITDSSYHSLQQQTLVAVTADTSEQHKKFIRNNWMNLIKVKKSRSHKTGRDNIGIYDLKVEVENPLDYQIDSVTILVPYYANGECVKAEYVKLDKIPAHGERTMKVPDHKLATSYQVQVRKVHSSALQFCFDIDDYNREGEDPYKCN